METDPPIYYGLTIAGDQPWDWRPFAETLKEPSPTQSEIDSLTDRIKKLEAQLQEANARLAFRDKAITEFCLNFNEINSELESVRGAYEFMSAAFDSVSEENNSLKRTVSGLEGMVTGLKKLTGLEYSPICDGFIPATALAEKPEDPRQRALASALSATRVPDAYGR